LAWAFGASCHSPTSPGALAKKKNVVHVGRGRRPGGPATSVGEFFSAHGRSTSSAGSQTFWPRIGRRVGFDSGSGSVPPTKARRIFRPGARGSHGNVGRGLGLGSFQACFPARQVRLFNQPQTAHGMMGLVAKFVRPGGLRQKVKGSCAGGGGGEGSPSHQPAPAGARKKLSRMGGAGRCARGFLGPDDAFGSDAIADGWTLQTDQLEGC